ncbi:hypothetical protein ACHAXS_011440 [Conticribra weissflogii]
MVRKTHRGGIGAIGSAKASYFHPSEHIRTKFPNDYKTLRLENVTIVHDGTARVNHKEQRCYFVNVEGIGAILHIVVKNFRVDQPPAVIFEAERQTADPPVEAAAASSRNEAEEIRRSQQNVSANVAPREEIAELRRRGIEVDDDNEPAPENAWSPPSPFSTGQWEQPTICPRVADVKISKFYVWLGCQFFMACFEGVANREEWWSTKPISRRHGAPFRLTEYMQKNRFLQITAAVVYTNKPPPSFVDKFHNVRNEYHSIADGNLGKPIMWRVKLQEGKDRPKDSNNKPCFLTEFESHTKTSALMLYMTKPIHNTGKIVTMDSGFCVAAGILALHDVGVYGQSLIKKHGRFWPKHVPGQLIDNHMKDKEIGFAATYKQSIGGKDFLVHCQKDDTYVTKILSTHGILKQVNSHITYCNIDGEWKTFKYVELMSRHNCSKH